jgi:hypothetical protein
LLRDAGVAQSPGTSVRTLILAAALSGAALAPALRADLCHVDGDVGPGGDGISWTSAYDDLQAALADTD